MRRFFFSVCLTELSVDHFHVHIVNASYYGTMGSTVGQAHLLDDIISLVCVLSFRAPVPSH